MIHAARLNAERIWKRFIQLCSVADFGEEAVLTEGKRTKNFLGSVERYESLYRKAVEEFCHISQEGGKPNG
jgi:hypothetical protein